MAVEWTEHRFAGGALALDVANTVVLRGDPARSFDRFDQAGEVVRFAEAAQHFRLAETGGALTVFDADAERIPIIEMREAVDALFRDAALTGHLSSQGLSRLLAACSESLKQAPPMAGLDARGRPVAMQAISLRAAVALSALALLPEAGRIRVCDNCRWLFLDRSRNGSRRWCDMAVCGNRQKAKRHYRRRASKGGEHAD